ncbi:MAG: glycosyltransferase, partial [bacterium]
MKTSLILTVFNEGDTIRTLLDSIRNQKIAPDEVIIVDGGSKDETVIEIKRFANRNSELNIKLFVKPGFNISKGRNFAIDKASGEIIFVTDGGCVLDKDWAANLCESFGEEHTEIVGGMYEGVASGYFQRCMNKLT